MTTRHTFTKLIDDSKLPNTFDNNKLKRHLLQLQDLAKSRKIEIKSVHDVANVLSEMQPLTRTLYSEVKRLVVLILSQPISVAQAERSFSCLRRLKTWLRSTMSQARLTHVAMISMHNKRLDLIDTNELISQFILKTPERRSVFGHTK